MKILFFGDVVGRIGRQAIKKILPELRAQYNPDVVIANVENIAHGTGITEKTLDELLKAGVDYCTAGDHTWDKSEADEALNKKNSPLIRPANISNSALAGNGTKIIEVGTKKLLLVNLLGQVFIKTETTSPFTAIDQILNTVDPTTLAGIIVDLHAEATSEKVAFGWYVDGRVSAVLGTHTHIPTADAKILPRGTGYVTDVGMVGALDSVLGMTKEISISRFLGGETAAERIPESGSVSVGAILLDINPQTKETIDIKRLDSIIEV